MVKSVWEWGILQKYWKLPKLVAPSSRWNSLVMPLVRGYIIKASPIISYSSFEYQIRHFLFWWMTVCQRRGENVERINPISYKVWLILITKWDLLPYLSFPVVIRSCRLQYLAGGNFTHISHIYMWLTIEVCFAGNGIFLLKSYLRHALVITLVMT